MNLSILRQGFSGGALSAHFILQSSHSFRQDTSKTQCS